MIVLADERFKSVHNSIGGMRVNTGDLVRTLEKISLVTLVQGG